jgi:hypothetical protein
MTPELPIELWCLVLDHCTLPACLDLKRTCQFTRQLVQEYLAIYWHRFDLLPSNDVASANDPGRPTRADDLLTLCLQLCFPDHILQTTSLATLLTLVNHHKQTNCFEAKQLALLQLELFSRHTPPVHIQSSILRLHPHLLSHLLQALRVTHHDIIEHGLVLVLAKLGTVDALQQVLRPGNKQGAFPDMTWLIRSLLHAAAQNPNPDTIKYLINQFQIGHPCAAFDWHFWHRLLCAAIRAGNLRTVQYVADEHLFLFWDSHHDLTTLDPYCADFVTEPWPLDRLMCAAVESGSMAMAQYVFDKSGAFERDGASKPKRKRKHWPTLDELAFCAIASRSADMLKFVCNFGATYYSREDNDRASDTEFRFIFAANIVPICTRMPGWANPEAMAIASLFGHLDTLKHAVEQHLVMKWKNAKQVFVSAFEHAADAGHLDIVRYLTPHILAEEGRGFDNALLFAAVHGHLPVVRHLVQSSKIHLDRVRDAFLGAVYSLQFEVAQYLAEAYNLTAEDARVMHNLALCRAASMGHLAFTKFLFEHLGLNVNDARDQHNRALMVASGKGHMHVVQYLVETAGLTPNDIFSDNCAILALAAASGQLAILQYLINKAGLAGTDYQPNDSGDFVLVSMVFWGDSESLDHLGAFRCLADTLKRNNIDMVIGDIYNSLESAIKLDNLPLLTYLVERHGVTFGLGTQNRDLLFVAMRQDFPNNGEIVHYLARLMNIPPSTIPSLWRRAHAEKHGARKRFMTTCCGVSEVDKYLRAQQTMTAQREQDVWFKFPEYIRSMTTIKNHYSWRAGLLSQHHGLPTLDAHHAVYPHECPRTQYLRHWLQYTKEPAPMSLIQDWPQNETFYFTYENFGRGNYSFIACCPV